jgi:predicted nucleic acid-binding protein
MDGFSKRLAQAKVIGLDTAIFIYFFENHPQYAPLAEITIKGIENGKWQGVTSTITLMEITVRPWQLGNETAAREYEAVLVHFPNLTIVDVDRNVARAAAQLRAKYKVSPPDALQVAASISFGAQAFLTNDKRLSKLEDVIDVIVLDDFLEE